MEKFTEEQSNFLIKTIDVLQKAKIEACIIRPSGRNDDSWTVGAMSDGAVYALVGIAPEFPGVLTLDRIDKIRGRIDLLKSHKNFELFYDLTDNGKEIKTIKVKAGRSSAEYRCSMEKNYTIPKGISGEVLTTFDVRESTIQELALAIPLYDKGGLTTFTVADGELTISLKDDNGDHFTASGIETDLSEGGVNRSYSSQVLGDLFRMADIQNETLTLAIGQKGILSIPHADAMLYVMANKVV